MMGQTFKYAAPVALLTESVDRNCSDDVLHFKTSVALLTESVDRNAVFCRGSRHGSRSLSSRRAWIEIH